MDKIDRQLVADLGGPSDEKFYRALSILPRYPDLQRISGAHLSIAVAMEMNSRGELSERRQGERLTALLHKLCLDHSSKEELSKKSKALPPGLRNTIAKILSPSQLLNLLGAENPEKVASTNSDFFLAAQEIDAAKLKTINESDSVGQRCSTVLLLSKKDNQEGNKKLLRENKFDTFQWNTIEKLREDFKKNTDICACLIDGSFLKDMNKGAQATFFKELSSYSTFAWLRIDESGLEFTQEEVSKIVRIARCQKSMPTVASLSFQPDGILRKSELPLIERASNLLRTHEGTQIIPREITDDEGRVLFAAVREHAEELNYDGVLKIISLETQFLQGGYTDAIIALVRVNREGKNVVAKINKKEKILEEIKRYRCFIQGWDDKLQAKASFHGEAAVILFILVSEGTDATTPAPMLEDCLKDLWNSEIFDSLDNVEIDRKAANLITGLENVISSICELNKKSPSTKEFLNLANPSMELFRKLEKKGFDWSLGKEHRIAREISEKQFEILKEAAVVHGDIHLRNILVRNGIDMHLIDYEGSGPGHPAIDIVRLELALFLDYFKQLEDERVYINFQKALTLENASIKELEDRFPFSHLSALNKVCVRGCVSARDNAINALKKHGGCEKDYIAAKYLLAWQNLLMHGRQTSLTRSVITAIAPQIVSW